MNNLGVLQTTLFVLFNLVMLATILGARPSLIAPVSKLRMVVGAALPPAALALFFFFGQIGPHDRTYTLKLNQFQVPAKQLENPKADADGRFVHFIAGEKPETSDLVVPPYADTLRAAEYVRDKPRPIFEVASSGRGDALEVALCRYNYAPSLELELPGWRVEFKIDDEPLPDAQGGRDCSFRIAPGDEPVQVALFREEFAGDKIRSRERRSFKVSRSQSGVRVTLDTAISTDIAECDPSLFRLLPGMPLGETIDFLPKDSVRPSQLGVGGANPVIEPRFLGETQPAKRLCSGRDTRYEWPAADGQDWRISGSIVRHFIPWFLVILFAVNAAVLFRLRAISWQDARAELCVVLILQWMLALRALIGVAGLYANPSLSRSAVLLDAGMAYVSLPAMAVLLLMRRNPSTPLISGVLVAMSAASLAALIISLGSRAGFVVPLVYVLITAGLAGLRHFLKADSSLLEYGLSRLSLLPALASGRLAFWQKQDKYSKIGQILIAIALLFRGGLLALGMTLGVFSSSAPQFSERVGPLTLSAIYQPLLVIGFGFLLVSLIRNPSWPKAIVLAFLWFVSLALLPVALSDFGIIWIFGWPVAMVVSWFAIRAIWAKRAVIAAPLSLFALAPLGVVAIGLFWASEPIAQPGSDGATARHMADAVEWNRRDQVRLLRFTAPEKLELLGNRLSFEMLDQAASLEPLVRSFAGKGYLEPSRVRRPIRDYQYNDNLLAIHIMWPFGRAGAMALLVFITGAVWALAPRQRSGELSVPGAVSIIAATTVSWAAIYMTLANLNLAPFTGRNVYLLAVTSGGDAIEGLAMVVIAASAWFAAPSLTSEPEVERDHDPATGAPV